VLGYRGVWSPALAGSRTEPLVGESENSEDNPPEAEKLSEFGRPMEEANSHNSAYFAEWRVTDSYPFPPTPVKTQQICINLGNTH